MKSSATYFITLLILIGTLAVNAQNSTLMGFSDEGSVQQIQLEEEFDELLNAIKFGLLRLVPLIPPLF